MTSNDNDHRGLLPAGLADLLPPDAAREARAIDVAIERFAAFGYERVKPPLVEFEESLLGGPGAALAPQTFRLMDPVSQRMMGVRPDMTVQVARIAVTRLKHEPRPLRLSYGGNVIRVRGGALKPERQFAQVGTELIGVEFSGGRCRGGAAGGRCAARHRRGRALDRSQPADPGGGRRRRPEAAGRHAAPRAPGARPQGRGRHRQGAGRRQEGGRPVRGPAARRRPRRARHRPAGRAQAAGRRRARRRRGWPRW